MHFIYMSNGMIKEKVSVCRPRKYKGERRERSNQSHPRNHKVVRAELHGLAALSIGKGSPVGGLLI